MFVSLNIGYTQECIQEKQRPSSLFPSDEVVIRFHNDWTVRSYKRRIAYFKRDIPKIGATFFIGNSITQQGGNWSKKFGVENIINRGISGDVTDGVLARLNEIIYYQPKAVFILIGINDLFNLHYKNNTNRDLKYDKIIPSARYVAKNIIKIAKRLHNELPKAKIYIRTVLPTRKLFLKKDILKVNKRIKKANKKDGYLVIDLYSVFVNDSGYLKKSLTKDGVHLNNKGYKKWVHFEQSILNKRIENK